MAIHLSEFDAKENKSQDLFLKSLFNDIVPASFEEPKIVILSGAMGSGKSIAVQYALNLLCSDYPGLQTIVGRISIKDVKRTFFAEFKIMTPSSLLSSDTKEEMVFKNGSKVGIAGWGGGDTSSLRSLNLNVAVIEEVTQDAIKQGYFELNKRALTEFIGRIRGKDRPNLIFLVSNPDSPSHWLYEDYIQYARYVNGKKQSGSDKKDNVHLFYSVTTDNKYLNKGYVKNMVQNFTSTMKERMIDGKWVDVAGEGVYNEYDESLHYIRKEYKINESFPVYLTWDFNTAEGKPMSVCMGQYINDFFHFFDECIIPNSNTRGVLEELEARGFFKKFVGHQRLYIDGDGTGWANDSSAVCSNYDVMKDFISKLPYKVNFKIVAPRSNPAISRRHNRCNAYLKNFEDQVRVAVYEKCKVLNKGFKSTRLKKGTMKEDDSNYNQHVTTAATYLIWNRTKKKGGISVIKG